MTFHSRHEAVSLHKYLTEHFAQDMEIEIHEEAIKLNFYKGLSDPLREHLTDALTEYMIHYYEEAWLVHIIKNTFYFTEEEDQEDILNIVKAIFEGEKSELPKVDTLPSREQALRATIRDILKDPSSFSLQSLETFRLTDYFECLTQTVELAIDEFKLQQEYSAFIDKLRRIVKAYRPLHQTIYAIDQETFLMYDSQYRLIEDPPSIRSFYPLLKQWGIAAEPSLLLTLIGLAPEQIYIFTDKHDESMLQTLQKVFEERVKILTLKDAAKLGLLFTG